MILTSDDTPILTDDQRVEFRKDLYRDLARTRRDLAYHGQSPTLQYTSECMARLRRVLRLSGLNRIDFKALEGLQ